MIPSTTYMMRVQAVPDTIRNLHDAVNRVPDDVRSVHDTVRAVPDAVRVVHSRFHHVPDFARTVQDWVRSVNSADNGGNEILIQRSFHSALAAWRKAQVGLIGDMGTPAGFCTTRSMIPMMQAQQVNNNNGLQNKGCIGKHPVERPHKVCLEYKCKSDL
jgi:hypothetical protein